MYKTLNKSINTDQNKIQVNLSKIASTDSKKGFENTPKDNANKIEENIKINDIVQHILYLNEENKKGQGRSTNTRPNA